METPDAQPAASSAAQTAPPSAVDSAVASGDMAAFKDARRAERSGTPLTPSADSSPAMPDRQAASTDASPKAASEPAKPAKNNAETRVQQLLKERHDLTQRLEALERGQVTRQPADPPKDAKPVESSTTTDVPAELKSFDAYQATHPEADWDSYQDARSEWRVTQALEARDRAHHERTSREQQVTRVNERGKTFHERVTAHAESDPEFWNTITPDVQELVPISVLAQIQPGAQATALNALAEEVWASPIAPHLMRHFSVHPEDLDRFRAMTDPLTLAREFGKLETALTKFVAKSPTKTITSAATPPTQLGGKSAEPSNEADAAVARGDVAGFKAARLRERMANSGRR